MSDIRQRIKALPNEGSFHHRDYYHQTQWDDIHICSYADLKALLDRLERLEGAATDVINESLQRYDERIIEGELFEALRTALK